MKILLLTNGANSPETVSAAPEAWPKAPKATKALSGKLKATLAAISIAVAACGGSEFVTEQSADTDAAVLDAKNDSKPIDSGKDANPDSDAGTGKDGDSGNTPDAEAGPAIDSGKDADAAVVPETAPPAEAGKDADLPEAAPDGPLCNKVTVQAVKPSGYSITAGQAVSGVNMMGFKVTSDCGSHTIKKVSAINVIYPTGSTNAVASMKLMEGSNPISTDFTMDPVSDKYEFENVNNVVPPGSSKDYSIQADFTAATQPSTGYQVNIACKDIVVDTPADNPNVTCQGTINDIYVGPIMNFTQ
jgi:hypothetical protein